MYVSRREFLGAAGAAAIAAGVSAETPGSLPPQPNIVLIMSDQHSKHVMGCSGDPVIATPNLDRLAAEGVLFENAYCPFPLCSPCRMAFLTGRQPHRIRAYDNAAILPSDVPTFAHALGQAGYDPILCGRMHFNGMDQRHGFRERVFPEVSGHAAGMLRDTTGFRRAGIEKSGPGRNHYLLYDTECMDRAIEWLKHRSSRENDKPFCLVIGLVGPHCPYVCPKDLFEKYYDAVDVPLPTPAERAAMHPFNRRSIERSKIGNATEHEVRRTRAAYYGMVEYDDRLIGRLMDSLAATGLRDNTAVIYTSDHGETAGEHGMWWKMNFYEGSVSVPLIVSFPGMKTGGTRERTPASLIDLPPTLTELAGAPQIPHMDGESLMPYLQGNTGQPDRLVFSELFCNPSIWTTQGPSGGPARMVRTGPWKCIYYHQEPPVLHNLDADPGEENNLAADPAYQEVLNELLAYVLQGWNPDLLQRDMLRLTEERDFVRKYPGERHSLKDEYWRGPEDYGHVDPV